MRWVALLALGLLSVLVVTGAVYAWWLGGGLLSVYNTAQDKADIAQRQLNRFQKSVAAGDREGAARHLRIAERAVDEAEDAARAPQVRVAKWLPYTRGTVADLDHLLGAASVVIDSADDVLTIYNQFAGGDSQLFVDGQIDTQALADGREAFRNVRESLATARSELRAVKGTGPLGDEALEKRRTGLKQIRSIQAKVRLYGPVVEALPDALGADGTKRYLVAIMNPAEMRGSGGAPLSVAMIVIKDGKVTVPIKGTTSRVTLGADTRPLGENPFLVWPRVKGDPFQPQLGRPQRFVNAMFNPDFRVSGEQMLRATPTFFGKKTDGVIAIDVVALARLLDVIGPIQSEYGELTSQNLVQELLVKSYSEDAGDVVGRQERNEALMSSMLSSLMAGGQLQGKMDALLSVAPARHVQMYFRDERLQRVVERRDLAGAVPTPTAGNLTAVYTQNGNGSKVDVFQQRTITQQIVLKKDGSAIVNRQVKLDNVTPPYNGPVPDPKFGYDTRWATNLVINLLPKGAKVLQSPKTDLQGSVQHGIDQEGRTYAQAAAVTPPGGSVELGWSYRVPHAAVRVGDAWRIKDQVVVQNTVNGTILATTVIAPDGWTTRRVDDSQLWYTAGNVANLQIGVTAPMLLQLDVVPAP
jgi:hypothetical protein